MNITLRGTAHSMKRRAPWHDYAGKGLYMVTLVVEGRRPMLGALMGTPAPHVRLTPLGYCILSEELPKIALHHPNASVWKAMIMPDHIHLIIHVAEPFTSGISLSDVIRGFKTGCNQACKRLLDVAPGGLFEKGFNDKILMHPERLDRWKRYLDDNPRRLWIKRSNPSLFTVCHDLMIAGQQCGMVGNQFLLDVPDKECVIFHRRYSAAELDRLFAQHMRCAEAGGVLVSAAIAPWERQVMHEAMARGGRVIYLRQNGFPPLYKPSGRAFDACAQGLLLQISPWEHTTQNTRITRAQCLHLNSLAEAIARG